MKRKLLIRVVVVMLALSALYPLYKGLSATMQARHASSPGTTLDDGLVGHWTFDGADMTSSTALDKSGNNNTGTLYNMSTSSRVAGVLGQGLQFDGTDDFINMYGSFNFTSSDFTISHWVKLNSLSTNIGGQGPVLIYKGSYQTNGYYSQVASDGVLFFATNQSGAAQSSSVPANTIVPGNWYHISYVRRGASVRIYVNGIDKTSVAGTHINPASSSGDFRIGQYFAPSISMNGLMDDVRIYNRALSADEIHQLYKMGEGTTIGVDPTSDPLAEGLAGYWKFDEGQGSTTVDSSVNHNNGTTTNMNTSSWTSGKIGGALDFDGADDIVTISPARATGNTFTITAWIKPDGQGGAYQTIFGQNESNVFQYNNYSKKLLFACSGNMNDGLTSVDQDSWSLATVVVTNGVGTYYLNGKPDGPTVSNVITKDYDMIGNDRNGELFSGSIDEVRIYNRPLSADEVVQLYRTTKPTEVDTSLVGHWTFDGPTISGTTVRDLSGAGNNGTLTNGPTKTEGVLGQALNFDGITGSQYVNAGSAANLDDLGPFTISTWIYPRSTGLNGAGNVASKANSFGGNGSGWVLEYISGKMSFDVDYATTDLLRSVPASAVAMNTWQHLVVTWDGSTNASNVHIYINGVESAYDTTTNASGSRVTDATPSLLFGNSAQTFTTWNGKIDDVRIYNRALSADEIYKMYKVGAGSKMNVDTVTPDLERGLAGYWPLDNATGTTASDLSVNGNNGTLTNGPTWSAGKIGGAVTFDGTDDVVTLPYQSYSFHTGNFTISYWVKTAGYVNDGSGINVMLAFGGCCGGSWAVTLPATNMPQFTRADTTLVGSRAIDDNSWHHVVVDRNGTVGEMYIDGVKESTTIAVADVAFGSDAPHFGNDGESPGSRNFTGSLDEVRIYNRALSAEEIAQLYRTTKPTQASDGLVGYWSFNGPDVTDKIYDRSGAGNNGYFVGGATTSAKTIGQVGQGLQFDGVDDYVEMPNLPDMTQVTLSTWMKLGADVTDPEGEQIITRDGFSHGTGRVWQFRINDDEKVCAIFFKTDLSNSPGVFSIGSVTVGAWHHVATSFDGNTIITYLDGQAGTPVAFSGTLQTNDSPIWLGRSAPNTSAPFLGSIDEVRIYNRALSAQEVKQLYNAGR